MSMSDDVAGATLQLASKAAESGMHMIDRTIDLIAKLLQMLAEVERNKKMSAGRSSTATNLTDLKSGEVRIRDLVADARKSHDPISASEQGLTDADKKYITRKAKEYGIPVAFTGDKENHYANVRTSDLPIFQRICTDMMKEKIAERPQELGNFRIKEWEMPFLVHELNKYDLSAQFGKTKSGEHFCLYEKKDEKAVLIARDEFIRKCNELKKEMTFDKDENGYYTLKDIYSGREISFDEIPSKNELSAQIQEKFGYDENKANIACAKFGEENLKGLEKQQFFSDNPQKEFSHIDTNIHIKNESIYTKEFTCWHMTPKTDHVPRVVFRNDESGKFAVLNPEKMTHKQMTAILKSELGLKDDRQINALIDKAEKVSDAYIRQENSKLDYTFSKTDFDMKNPDVVSQMRRTDADGNVFTKAIPVDSVSNEIERKDTDTFTVKSTVSSIEISQNGETSTSADTQTLQLSFSDKKDSIHQMTQIYKRQGIPEHIAKQMAKDVFRMAENQNPEKAIQIEEVKEKSVILSHHEKKAEINLTKPEKAVAEISDTFDISQAQSEQLLEMTNEKFNMSQEIANLPENEPEQELNELIQQNQQSVPDDSYPDYPEYMPEEPDWMKEAFDNTPIPEPPMDMPDIPDMPVPPPTMGGRR